MNKPAFNYKFVLIVSICLFVFGVAFGFWGFPKLLRKLIKSVRIARFCTLNYCQNKFKLNLCGLYKKSIKLIITIFFVIKLILNINSDQPKSSIFITLSTFSFVFICMEIFSKST